MNGQVDQYDDEGNHEEQGSDAQAVSQAETYHPNDDQNSESVFNMGLPQPVNLP